MERAVIGAAIVLLQRLGGEAHITQAELDVLATNELCFWFDPQPDGIKVEVITEAEAENRQKEDA